ncbi:MAG: peptidylprolyl isomerase [Gammaproteobacteria bacterium]|nr:peptidylprolyl isomerase [Gammaproteobacteria bacterium]
MNVAPNKVICIHYTLRDDAGAVIDSSSGREPLAYLHGTGNLIPGLESALEGKATGETLEVTIAPEQAYGKRDERLVQIVARSKFGEISEIVPGMQVRTSGPGGSRIVTVTHVERDLVTIDANHPLAGKTLHFHVQITEVRQATRDELKHGHVHGPGGHHH